MLYMGESLLKLLVEICSFCCICHQQIVYKMEGFLVLLPHSQFFTMCMSSNITDKGPPIAQPSICL